MDYDLFYSLKKASEVVDSLSKVIQSDGVPKDNIVGGARAEIAGRFGEVAKEYHVKQ
jgi:hypothetical protein